MSDADAHVDERLDGLRQIALAVAVVAARDGDRRSFCTGTLTYVSVDPAMILTPLASGSRTLAVLRAARAFSVTLLGAASRELAVIAGRSSPSEDKFAALDVAVREGPDGLIAPAVAGALAVLWCSLTDELPTGDHVGCVGRVEGVLLEDELGATPLVRFRRDYFGLAPSAGPPDDVVYPI